MSDLTREDFRRWGREGGLAGRKTPRRTCSQCRSFVGPGGECKRCKHQDVNRHNPGVHILRSNNVQPVVGGLNGSSKG